MASYEARRDFNQQEGPETCQHGDTSGKCIECKIDSLKEEIHKLEDDLDQRLNRLGDACHENARQKGFYDDIEDRIPAVKIALMHSELSEALEAYRHGEPMSVKIPGFKLAEEEFADCIIRILDWCAFCEYDIDGAVSAKMNYNSRRKHKHNKLF